MHPVIYKTLGGLSPQYYFRQFLFGLLIAIFIFYMASKSTQPMSIGMMMFTVVSTLLYPYSRFVYESIVGFVMGENILYVNAVFMFFTKLLTMAMCWIFALFVAPVGFAYLYYRHSKIEG